MTEKARSSWNKVVPWLWAPLLPLAVWMWWPESCKGSREVQVEPQMGSSQGTADDEAVEMVNALRVYYGTAREAHDAHVGAMRCAYGDPTNPNREECLSACSALDCKESCYEQFGGKRLPADRMKCMEPFRERLKTILVSMPESEFKGRCAKQAETAVVRALGLFQVAKGDPHVGHLPPFPWSEIQNGYSECAALFKCGTNRAPCTSARLAGGLGLRPDGSLRAEPVWLPSGTQVGPSTTTWANP